MITDRESRRNFLRQITAASFLPLAGLKLPQLGSGYDEHYAKRLHSKVLAAFDFGAALPTRPYTTTFIAFSEPPADVKILLANLQHSVAELKRGREYSIITSLTSNHWPEIDSYGEEIRVTVALPRVTPMSYYDRTHDYWRHVDRRQI